MIDADDLTQRITIERPKEIATAGGGYTTSWQPVATIWAEVRGLAGRESVIEHALQGIEVVQVRIRFRRDLDPTCQIVRNGRRLNIRSATDPDGRREELVIIADSASTLPAD